MTDDALNRNNIKITHRDGRVTRETRPEFECVRLTNVYNRVAYDANVIDVCVEWDDNPAAEHNPRDVEPADTARCLATGEHRRSARHTRGDCPAEA